MVCNAKGYEKNDGATAYRGYIEILASFGLMMNILTLIVQVVEMITSFFCNLRVHRVTFRNTYFMYEYTSTTSYRNVLVKVRKYAKNITRSACTRYEHQTRADP